MAFNLDTEADSNPGFTTSTKVVACFPLSFPQQRMWFISQLLPHSPVYNVSNVFELNGHLNIEALQQSLSEIVRRHESLRTTFHMVGQQPMQAVAAQANFVLFARDLTELDSSEKEIQANEFINEESRRLFPLETGPLFRASLLRLTSNKHILILNLHHIVCDGWSLQNLFHELGELYNAFSQGQPSPLPELEFRYSDFATWQRSSLRAELIEKQLNYWKRQLENYPSILKLPYDRRRPMLNNYQGKCQIFHLPDSLYDSLIAFSQQQKITPYMILLAAFNALLFRYSGQSDILIGSIIANRTQVEHEALIGAFINTLVFRTDLNGDPTFLDLLRRVRETAVSAYSNQDVPFEKLIEELEPERLLGQTPLFQTLFDFQKDYFEELTLRGLTLRQLPVHNGTAKLDLTLSILQGKNHLTGTMEYSTAIFDDATILRMLGHFQTLLKSSLENPHQRISTLPLLTPQERHQLLIEWNNTSKEYPAHSSIQELFEAQVARQPDAKAVVFGSVSLTYEQLNSRANQLARYLESNGVSKNTLIAVCLERSSDMIVALLAILKAGAAYLPLDPSYPQERLAFMLSDSQAPLVITSMLLASGIPQNSAGTIVLEEQSSKLASFSKENLPYGGIADNLAYVIYTSGSTGKPKGVCIQHHAVNRLVCNTNYASFSPFDRVAQISDSSFDALTFEVWGALIHGACLVVIPKAVAISPSAFVSQIRKEGITVMFLASALFNAVIREFPDGFHSVEQLIVGGEALDARWIREAIRNGPPMKLINGYGPTESTTFAITYPIREVAEDAISIPIGRPISNTRIYILDSWMEPVPIGVLGEIYIGGEGLALGYLHRPDLTGQKFVRDPFSHDPRARLYRTGDVARFLADGNIEFIGRVDNQIKIRGYRVELEEIETILGKHQGVEKALVVYTKGPLLEKTLVACIVPRSHPSVSVSELRDFLKTKLPEYMVPSHFTFVDALPVGPGGKIDRHHFVLPLLEKNAEKTASISPREPLEEAIAGVWCEILGLTEIGIDEGFFDRGGHSLLATQVISRIRKLFSIDLPLLSLFEESTVRKFSERIRKTVKPEDIFKSLVISRVPRDEDLPPSFPQERLWFLDQLSPANPFYNVCYPFRLKGTIDTEALHRSLNEIVRRHEILRTTFSAKDGKPVQIVHPHFQLELALTDLGVLPQNEREERSRTLISEEARRPFDLGKGPLFRAGLLRLDENDHVLLLNWHHIIFDGWSLSIFWRELRILYQSFVRGRSSPLPELAFQYADFAAWQRHRLKGDFLENQLTYWENQLSEIPPFLELPADRPRPVIESFRGSTHYFQFPKTLQDSLMELSRREGATLFMTLITAFMTLLHRYTDQDDIVVGSPIANRGQSDIESLIGFFVNTLVIKGKFQGHATFLETLANMREVCLQGYAHQDLPFEKLVETMQPERSLSHSPLFQVMFILQNAPSQLPQLPGLEMTEIRVERGTAGFDLKLSMDRGEDALTGSFEYNTDLFNSETIARMTSHFQILLEGIVGEPNQVLSKLPLLSEKEKNEISVEWNDTDRSYSFERCIHELFEEQARRTPNSVAIVSNGTEMTFGELNRYSNILANHLRNAGIKVDTVVGICAQRSVEMIAGLLGILKAGGAFLPLDPALPSERLNFLLKDSQAQFVLCQKNLNERIVGFKGITLFLDTDWKNASSDNCANPVPDVTSENLAYLLYTSGSTGVPKAVLGTHRASLNRFHWMWEAYPFERGEFCCQKTSLNFVDSIWEIFGPLLRGVPIVIIREEAVHDPQIFTKVLAKNRVTRIVLVPSLLAALLNFGITARELPTLKFWISSGEPLKPELCHKFHQAFPGKTLLNLYGSTEVAADVTYYQTHSDDSEFRTPVGRPIANIKIYILDKYLNLVPVGVPGEVHVAGVGLARGYLNHNSATAGAFIPNPFSSQQGSLLYKTGDLARYLPDGTIDLIGRIDSQIKIRGYRVEPAEIEAALNCHPQVRQCAVGAFEDAIGEKNLIAYIVPSEIPGPSAREFRSFLQTKLPDFMIPSLFEIVEDLPFTSSGKVNRKALSAPKNKFATAEFDRNPNTVERQLLEIWKEILPVQSIGLTDNFFDIGGHSLLAVRLVAAIDKKIGRRLPLAALFQGPTIEHLALMLQQKKMSAVNSSLIPIRSNGSKPPFFCAPGLSGSVLVFRRLASLLGKEQPVYGLQPVGFDDEQSPHEEIGEMAAHFVRQIRRLQPHGPYFLGGYSFGGFVVFEMAQQLTSEGEKVALLAILDTQVDASPRRRIYRHEFLMRLHYHFEVLSELDFHEKYDYFINTFKRLGQRKKTTEAKEPHGAFQKIKEANTRATLAYTPQPYPAKITIFRAGLLSYSDPELSWGPLAKGGIEVHSIPALHKLMAREGSLRILSRKLRDCLERAQRECGV